jgi:thiamine-monophosphate kinase
LSRAWIEEFYDGLLSLAAHYGVAVVGGDTARVRGAAVADVTVLGEQASGQILRRSGARPGDLIFVSGRLGLGELGWRILRRQQAAMRWKLNPTDRAAALRAHLYPEPQCALGEFLARNGLASAAMDISDGLAKDLSRLAQASQVGALVEEARIPAPEFIPRDAAQRLALAGGEDYQLLFTVPPAKARRIPRAFRSATLHRIGSITGTGKLRLSRQNGKETDLEPLGYDHFRRE